MLGAGLAAGLAACTLGGAGTSGGPSVVPSTPSVPASASPTSSASVTPSQTPTKPSASPSAVATKATGSLSLFSPVSTRLTGTCQRRAGGPTLTVADHANDFFQTVDVTIVLTPTVDGITSISAAFGEDSENISRALAYQTASPIKGTSATFRASGNTYKVSGKAQVVENDGVAKTRSILPFSITVTCASADWLATS